MGVLLGLRSGGDRRIFCVKFVGVDQRQIWAINNPSQMVGLCPRMSSNKQLIFPQPINKGIKNLTGGTAPAKVAVERRRLPVKKTVVDSQPSCWRR